MGTDQTEIQTEATDQADQVQPHEPEHAQQSSPGPATLPTPSLIAGSFDLLAFGILIFIAASFAFTARLNAQPPSSLVPAAVLSATGCGLLVTALRKLRTAQRPGLFIAGLAGFVLALFQFIAAISYPGVLNILTTDQGQRLGFFATWGLVASFSIIFSVAGAALGHLCFAPLRPLPVRSTRTMKHSATQLEIHAGHSLARTETPLRSFVNYLITVLLLGLAPTLVGFVFSAAFDYMLGIYQFTPGPYPTSRLLSAMLPWQIPIHLDFSSSSLGSIVLLLWRIPAFVGNPTAFDVQALEPLVFNGAALGLLLLTMHGRNAGKSDQGLPLSWLAYLGLEIALGLFLVLPADLWMLGGLQGLLQVPRFDIVMPIPTLIILDQRAFVLNLITGPVVCLGLGLLLRESKPQRKGGFIL
ncbi:MAG TPA: hypothetical protein VFN02_03610 [Ktedonobacteraceae bacterium]|nr:hypothetical protein [Ktedonobacteraceae bacterium]